MREGIRPDSKTVERNNFSGSGKHYAFKPKMAVMSAKPSSRKESIRVVPLHQPKLEGELEKLRKTPLQKVAAPPQLSYRGGPLLPNVEIFTIFCGADWAGDQLKTLSTQINIFLRIFFIAA